jgi:glycosyltransferase involved in cell wall biosynthesis
MRALRFCMVTTFFPPYGFGGDAVFVHRLSDALAERGHSVDIVYSEDAYRTLTGAEPRFEFAFHPRVTRHALRGRWPAVAALVCHQTGTPGLYRRRLTELVESRRFDVIHYHNVSLAGGPGVLKIGSAVKLYTPHEYWLICPTHVLFRFGQEACTERACFRCTLRARRPPQLWRSTRHLERCLTHVDRFLMPSQFALERHRADGIHAPMTVLNSFVPAPAAGEDAPVAERPYFLYAGRLEKLKGVQDLIRVFQTYRGADLLIVGDGTYRRELERAAAGLEHVRFIGALHPKSLGAYYRQAIAVLVPSLCYEMFALVPAEALSYGTPVIARRLGALTEVIEASGGGLLFNSLDECREACDRLVVDRALRSSLGERGRAYAHRHWTTDVHLERYLGIVDELLKAKAAPRGAGPS